MTEEKKKTAEIYKILSFTPQGKHAWVESSIGKIKKPIWAIPKDVLEAWKKETYIEIKDENR
jgi:hypothetical protein